jgi:hypothetical protein
MIELAGRELPAMDFGGCSDPYFMVYLVSASGQRIEVCKSEILMSNLNPNWQPRVMYVPVLPTVRITKNSNRLSFLQGV